MWLAMDTGTWANSTNTLGTAGTLQNSQCALNVGSSTGTLSGNTYTLNLVLTFQAAYAGTKNVYGLATSTSQIGLTSGWQTGATWTVPTPLPPQAVSVSPSSGSGASQLFSFVFSDPNGSSSIVSAELDLNAGDQSPHACYLYFSAASNLLYLAGDSGSWQAPITLNQNGTTNPTGTTQNSQCTVGGGASSILTSGPTLTLNLAISFTYSYAGSLAIWMEADDGTLDSGWVQRGTWTAPAPPLLQITSTHNGNFTQGQAGAYTVTVTNSGAGPTVSPVTVTETLPGGLTLVSMAGTGWTCITNTNTCARSDALAGSSSYPPITVTVNVAANAAPSVTNSVTVSGGNSAPNSAGDPTTIMPPPSLTVTLAQSGAFTQGQTGAYTVAVSNASGAGPTGGTVTVTETLPSGLTLVSMAGTGWACTNTCTRIDVLAGGSSYPAITVTVSVAANATSPQVNSVSVSGGNSAPNTGIYSTNIISDFTIGLSAPNPATVMVGGAATYTVTVAPLSNFNGTVALTVLGLPSGFSASFSPATITGSGASTMTVTTPASGAGNLSVTVNGSSGSLSHNGSATLAMQDFTVALSPGYPSSVTVAPFANATWTVVTSGLNGFSQPISLSYVSTSGENLPSCTVSNVVFLSSGYSTASINPGQTATLVISAGSAPQYSCFFQILASYGGTSHTMSGYMIQQGTGDFVLTQPASQTVSAGSAATFQAAYTPINGFTGTVGFSVTGLPIGAAATSQSPLSSPLQGDSLTVNVPAGVVGGTYLITITATSGNIVHTAITQLIVQGGSTFSISTSPPQTTAPGGTAQYTVTVSGSGGLGNVTLTATGGPPGATVLINGSSSASVAVNGTATMTVATPLNAGLGSYAVNITGMLGTVPKYATALTNITQAAPASIISPVPGQISSGQSTFTWNSGNGATQYQLTVGSSVGGTNYYSASLGSAQSASVNIPSTASAAYVTLTSLTPVGWLAQSYVYGVPAALGSVMQLGSISLQPSAPPVTISSPVPSDTITGCSVPSAGVTAVIAGAAGAQTVTFTASASAQLGTTNIACSTAAQNTLALTAHIETYADGITGVQTTWNGGGSYTVSISGYGFSDDGDVYLDNDRGQVTYGSSWFNNDIEIDMSIPDGVCSTTSFQLVPDGSDDPDDFAPAPLGFSLELCPDVAAPPPTLHIISTTVLGASPVDVTNTNQSVYVGQLLSLAAVVQNSTGTPTFQWTQPPGNIAINWDPTADNSQGPKPFNQASLQTSEIFFAWTDTSANEQCATPGQCVQVTATIPGSPPLSAGVQYNVMVPPVIPVVQQSGTTQSVSCPNESGVLAMCNYDPNSAYPAGITFDPSPPTSQFEWLQIVNSAKLDYFAPSGAHCEKNTSGRDGPGALPFCAGLTVCDAPGVVLTQGDQTITAADNFSTFMMYEPTPDDMWVPLYRIDWSWSDQAQASVAAPTGWQLSSPLSGGPAPSLVRIVNVVPGQPSQYPVWNQQADPGAACETVTAPTTPIGTASGSAGTSYTYTTGGSTSSVGNPVQYQFTWGDGAVSPWSSVGAASHSWVGSGTYAVTAQARSTPNPSLVSPTSSALTVVIQ